MTNQLHQLVSHTAAEPVSPVIAAMAEHVRQQHNGVQAVLAYGSALRDSTPDDTLIDLYVLTRDFAGVSTSAFARLGCRLVPPNVYHAECSAEGRVFHAKYAVLPMSQFAGRMEPENGNPYFWARFCQPARIVWAADEAARDSAEAAIEQAVRTAHRNALALAHGGDAATTWTALFANTYRTELRPESSGRARLIVEANAIYYDAVAAMLAADAELPANWAMRRLGGKALSVLRLVKAAFTFQGGADYIAWKIKRHSGVAIEVTDWMRRHPLLAAIVLLPRLLTQRAFK